MCTLDDIVTEIGQDCAEEYRQRMRARLMQQPREWLVEQLLDRAGGSGGSRESGGSVRSGRAGGSGRSDGIEDELGTAESLYAPFHSPAEIEARAHRIRAMQVDERCLAGFTERCGDLDRDALEAKGYLVAPPPKGAELVAADHRSRKGHALLREAKDLLHALLFGDRAAGVRFDRVHRELLTITVPDAKAAPLTCLLRAATVIDAEGTWRDPERAADDDRRPNALIQVEYGEVATEAIGHAIVLALRLINDLEINEQVLYARMENVEESTLV